MRPLACACLFLLSAAATAAENIYPVSAALPPGPVPVARDVPVLGADGVQGALDGAAFAAQPRPCVQVSGPQARIRLRDDAPVFLTPATTLSWWWKKEQGGVCIVQLALRNADTGQTRYFGYAAGAWSEPASADPTVELFVSPTLPKDWTEVHCALPKDIATMLGWSHVQVTEVYLSPWDGKPGAFADMVFHDAASMATGQAQPERGFKGGGVDYAPQRLRGSDERHIDRFETSFEECAPGRNSASNEWTAFGIDGDRDFNAIGRDLHVRYPAFDLVFRLFADGKEIEPDTLDSFRIGLMNNRLPAVWGAWAHGGLWYRVTAMTTPGGELGNYDLYKLQIQNPGKGSARACLGAVVEGPPDVRLDDGVVRGLGDAPFLVADGSPVAETTSRDWGLCDKRAKAYAMGGGPGTVEPAMATCRIGLDGVPVTYRFKAEPGRPYTVCLATTPNVGGYYLDQPKEPGDLVYEYRVEGCAAQTLDHVAALNPHEGPLFAAFAAAHDLNGDGFIEVSSGVTKDSRLRHTRLSVIYVFPDGTDVSDVSRVCGGAMNAQCVFHIDVGATPEQGASNQEYDKSDIGFARLTLGYTSEVAPGETKTYWIKVPSIHRREPVSMGYVAHAFRDVFPGEAVPPFPDDAVAVFKAADPAAAEAAVVAHWDAFFAKAAKITTPDPVLTDIFLSRLATRAIMDIKVDEGAWYNACSPYFYFDHAYRDQAYVVYAYDLAGLHDRAARILEGYCKNVADVKRKGPISFDGKPLQLGMLENGLWNTRPGQFDTQGENLWALVQHYKLSGDRDWLESTAYPFIRRGAMWIVDSRHRHMDEVKDPADPRYGLIEPGAMEVMEVGKGMHMYYMNAFAILGLAEAADAAKALGLRDDAEMFARERAELKEALHKSFKKTFKRIGLYEGQLWFGVEPEGVGMYGYWAHNCLLWPCRALDPQDPMLTATTRRMERMSNEWGGGMHSEGPGGYWPYIGVDRAVGHILRGEPDKALDYFCAFTDTAGGTFSWGEGYSNVTANGDQPHFWADGQWVNLFRQTLAMEDGNRLMVAPAMFRRWTQGTAPLDIRGLPTAFGDLDLALTPAAETNSYEYRLRLSPQGGQSPQTLERLLLYPRTPGGRAILAVECDTQPVSSFDNNVVILPPPANGREQVIRIHLAP
jgi:hypothetical protein